MKFKTKHIRAVIIAALILIILGVIWYVDLQSSTSDRILYQTHWKIPLPEELKEVYSVQTPTGFLSDGTRYTIFEVDPQIVPEIDNLTREKVEYDKDLVMGELHDMSVKEEQFPHFTHEIQSTIMKTDMDEISFIFDKDCLKLFVLEILR